MATLLSRLNPSIVVEYIVYYNHKEKDVNDLLTWFIHFLNQIILNSNKLYFILRGLEKKICLDKIFKGEGRLKRVFGCRQKKADAGRWNRMGADIMYQFESVVICLNQCLLKQAKEVNHA